MNDFKVGYNLKKLNRVLGSFFRRKYASSLPNGLCGPEGMIIGFLDNQPNKQSFVSEVIDHFMIKKSTASESLSKLKEAGLIDISKSQSDKRKMVVSLTDKGIEHAFSAKKVLDAFEIEIASKLNEEEKQSLSVIVNKLMNAFEGGKNE